MDEQQAIQASRQGDLTAFNQLVLAHQGSAYNLALRIMGDADTAADVTQDSFLKAHRGLGGFRGGSFKAWLLQIVARTCYDRLRAERRHPSSSLDAAEDDEGDGDGYERLVAPGEGPDEYVLRQELAQAIQAGLLKLPVDQRLALVLCDVEGLEYLEIAQVTGASLGTVKSRIARGRARLRDLLVRQRDVLPRRWLAAAA